MAKTAFFKAILRCIFHNNGMNYKLNFHIEGMRRGYISKIQFQRLNLYVSIELKICMLKRLNLYASIAFGFLGLTADLLRRVSDDFRKLARRLDEKNSSCVLRS